MFCGSCGVEIKEGAKFCGNCGWLVPETSALRCSNCGAVFKEGAKFCAGCGKPSQPPEAAPQSAPAYAPPPAAVQPQNTMSASAPVYNQPPVVKSAVSKSGVTALVLSIAAFIAAVCSLPYMVVDGWFDSRIDWIAGYAPLFLTCLVSVVFGLTSIYRKRSKQGLAGIIITMVNIALLFGGHFIADFYL